VIVLLDSVALREAQAGYALADEVSASERAVWLERLTPAESLASFRELWRVWSRSTPDGDLAALDRLKIQELVERRHRMDCLATRRESKVHREQPA
jgi:hypothetical protein